MLTLFRISTGDDWTRVSTGRDLRARHLAEAIRAKTGNFARADGIDSVVLRVFARISGIVLRSLRRRLLDNFGESSGAIAKTCFSDCKFVGPRVAAL